MGVGLPTHRNVAGTLLRRQLRRSQAGLLHQGGADQTESDLFAGAATEVYRAIHETLDSAYPITAERVKLLESAAEQIEHTVSDLEQRVDQSNQRELEFAESHRNGSAGP